MTFHARQPLSALLSGSKAEISGSVLKPKAWRDEVSCVRSHGKSNIFHFLLGLVDRLVRASFDFCREFGRSARLSLTTKQARPY